MLTAIDPLLVLRWTCAACGNVNYYAGSAPQPSEEMREIAEDLGCEVDDLATVPQVICCQKCEEAHRLPDTLNSL